MSDEKLLNADLIGEVARQKAAALNYLKTLFDTSYVFDRYPNGQVQKGKQRYRHETCNSGPVKFMDCYQGKKKGVICRFVFPENRRVMEIPLSDVQEKLMGGHELFNTLTADYNETHSEESLAEVYEENPLFGAFS